ncbi:cytochrome C [Geobacter grbiciae]|nr:cytochrome C [Geobacter grbiciae]
MRVTVTYTPPTTLGNGATGTNATVCPGDALQKLDGFSFTTATGTDSISALTVTTTNGTAIASMSIWDEAGTTQYFSTMNNPGTNTWSFSGGTPIPVDTTVKNYKVLVTYKDHPTAPAGSTATTAAVTAFTPSTGVAAGTDTADTTLTLDNVPGTAAVWGTNTGGVASVTLNWTLGAAGESVVIVRYGANTDTTMPVDGTSYTVGSSFGTGGTVAYAGSGVTATDTVQAGTYYYRIFEYDGCFNYAATAPWSTAVTATPQNKTVAGSASAMWASPTSISVMVGYTNDDNSNNNITIEYSSVSASTGFVTAVTTPTHPVVPYQYTIAGLTTGNTYWVRVTWNDVDGVLGTSPTVLPSIVLTQYSPLLHNSAILGSNKWPSGWGVTGGKYGAFSCTTCHTMKSANIKRVRTSITAPFGNWSSSGTPSVSVSFTNLTSMGHDDDNHTTSNRVCEVCHNRNKYHNFNTAKNTGGKSHNNGLDCVGCHSHNQAFKGEESRGGKPCTNCHNSGKFASSLKGTNGYHHYLQSTDSITYGTMAQPALTGGATDTNRNCLMCHVDHDIFRPDINLNAGSGRAKNLRADISTTPTAANTASYANTDFIPDVTKNGGICISCHRTAQTNLGYTQPDGSQRKPAIPYPDTVQNQIFVYMSSAHNYTVSSTFSGTGTNSFVANCSKCHNDTLNPKSGYNAQGTSRIKFGNHTTSIPQMLTTFGAPVTSSQKADYCFKCHGNVAPFSTTTPNINVYLSTPRYDWYSTSLMTARTKNLAADFNDAALTHKHQVQLAAYADKHHAGETRAELSANKHVTCDDCHNHHGSKKGLHIQAGPRNLSPALKGAMGVTPPTWTAWSTARAAGTTVTWPDALVPASEEWQICFKCHSSYNTNQAGWVGTNYGGADMAIQLNPTYKSGHAIIGNSRVPADSPSNFAAGTPWNKNSIMTCTDCHVNSNTGANDPKGGHASANPYMLRGNYQPTLAATVDMANHGPAEMCGLCHNPLSYGISSTDPTGTQGSSGFSSGTNNLHLEHAFRQGISGYKCSMCHAANIHGSPRQAMFVLKTDPAPYMVGSDHVGSFTRKANKTYNGSECKGGIGACSAGIHTP